MNGLFVNTDSTTMGTTSQSYQEPALAAMVLTPSSAQAHPLALSGEDCIFDAMSDIDGDVHQSFPSSSDFNQAASHAIFFGFGTNPIPVAYDYGQNNMLSPPGTSTGDVFPLQQVYSGNGTDNGSALNCASNSELLQPMQHDQSQTEVVLSEMDQKLCHIRNAGNRLKKVKDLPIVNVCPEKGCFCYGSKKDVINHLAKYHNVTAPTKIPVLCGFPMCNKKAPTLASLRARHHLTLHSFNVDADNIACGLCGGVFSLESKLDEHFNSVHCTKDQLIPCSDEKCQLAKAVFRRRDHYKEHRYRIHKDSRPPKREL